MARWPARQGRKLAARDAGRRIPALQLGGDDLPIWRPHLKTFFTSDGPQCRHDAVTGVNKAACRTPMAEDLNNRRRRRGDGIGKVVGKLCKHASIIANTHAG